VVVLVHLPDGRDLAVVVADTVTDTDTDGDDRDMVVK